MAEKIQKPYFTYYLSALLFAADFLAAVVSIEDNIKTLGGDDPLYIERSIGIVVLTIGVGLYAYSGLVPKNSKKDMPASIRRFGKASFIISILLVLAAIATYIWLIVSPPDWGY